MPQFLVELEDGQKFNVESDIEPTDADLDEYFAQQAPAPRAPVSAPAEGFFGQVGQKLATGTRAALSGAQTTLAAATGFNDTAAQGLSDMAATARQRQAERTPQDIAFDEAMQRNAAEVDAAPTFMGQAREFADYAGIALQNPRAAFQMGMESLPNAVISIPAAAAGKAVGAGLGLMAGAESGPGAIIPALGGMAAGSIGANVILEGGRAIADKISAATNGESDNWNQAQFKAFIDANPEIVTAGLKSGAIRGSVIGAVDAATMGIGGRILKPGIGAMSRRSIAARGAAVTGLETASEGAGEALAGLADTGRVDSQAVAQEMLGSIGPAIPGAIAGRLPSAVRALRPDASLAPVADPLAAAAASFPTQPPPSPPTAQVSPPPLPTQPPAPAAPATAPTQTWNVELDDGRQFVVESDTQPTAADIEDFLATPPPSASVNAAIPPVPQRGAATVDEGIAGSTPAAGALSPSPSPQVSPSSSVPLATRKVPVIEDAPYGGRDVLDFVNDNPIVIPQIAIGGDMDWAEKAGLPKTYAKFLTLPGDTGNINEVAQDAYDLNIISEPTPDALMAEIQKTIESRESYKADAKSQQSQMSQAEKARVLFDKAVTRAARRKTGTQRVPIDSMNKGDTITLGGETMTVVAQDVNDDGFNNSVTLRSESGRLGTVTLDAATTADLAVEGFEKAPPPEDTSGTWADDVIRGSMETPFIGLDPVLMAAYTVKGAQLIREGFTTFAQWSAEMLRRFGEKVRNYLQGAWQAARKTSQRGSIGGDPLDTRGRGNAMASTEGAAQSNEPSPGGLTEAEVEKLESSIEKLGWSGPANTLRGRALRAVYESGKTPDDVWWHGSARGELDLSKPQDASYGGLWLAADAQDALPYTAIRSGQSETWDRIYAFRSFAESDSKEHQLPPRKNVAKAIFKWLEDNYPHVTDRASDAVLDSLIETEELQANGIYDKMEVQEALEALGYDQVNSGTELLIINPVKALEKNWIQSFTFESSRAAEGTSGFKNLDTSGTTAGFLNTDIVNEAVDLIRQGFTDFANWSRAMITRFGRAIQEYLQGIWQAATTRTMPRMGGGRVTVRRPEGGFIQPGSPSPADPSEVKLTQDTIAAEREAAGRDALPTGGQFTVEQLTADARAEVQKPGRVQAILDDILAQQRPATPLEHYTLLNFKGQLDAELAQAEGILSDPATTEDDRGDAAARKREADAMKDKLEVVAQISGSRAGAALGVRRFGLDREDIPTLNKMVADITIIMDPTGRTPLPPEERAKIEEMHKTIIDTKAAADIQQEEGVGGAKNTFNLELEKLLKEAQAQIAAQEAALKQAALDLTNAAKPRPQAIKDKGILKAVADRGAMARERLRAKGFFGGTTNVGIDPSIILDLAEAGMGFLAEGADFTIRMVQEFGEKIRPFLGQIRDKSEQLLRGETQKKTVSDVKSKAQETVRRTGKAPDNLARQFALAHIIDHLERQDPTLTAEKIAKLVADDLQEFFPGIQVRQARDLISGYGKSTQPSKEEARVALRDLSTQMQKLTQLEALLKKEPLLKSGPQRQEPSARLRELQKQVEQLKKDTGYTGRSREDELKSIRDRIQKTLENQIEELQRVLAGQGTPTAPRQRQVYDANLQALQTLRNSLKVLVAELPQHRLASELRRNTAAEAAAKASETEYNRRIKAKEWKAQGKIQGPQTQAVTEARAAAAAARQQFLDLKRAAQPNFDPNAKELAAFKKRIQGQIDKLNERIAKGEFDPVKRTPRQIKHDADSAKLLTELNKAKRAFIDAKVAAKLAKMGLWNKGFDKLRTFVFTARSLMAGGEFSGIGRQGLLKALTHPVRFAGDLKAMMKAFKSEAGETEMFMELAGRPNAINGRYKRAKLALHNPEDYSDLIAEGAARSKLANKIPWFSHTGRAYTALLSHMRADLFDSLVAKYERRTKAEISDSAAAAIAEFVNDSTGSGKLGIGNIELRGNQKDLASLIFFSPSFMASRLRLLTGASLLGGNLQTRAIIGEEYIRIMAGYAALFALAAALQGDDEEEMELDPRGSGWLKMQFGATSVDLMAGLNSMATFLTRTITGETKTKDGTLKPIRGEDVPMGQSWIDIAQRFARGKFSPGAAFVTNRLTGTDPMGNAESALQGLRRSVTPITFAAAWDAAMEEPLNRSAAMVPAAFLGVSTNTKRPKDASFLQDLGRMAERLTGFNP